jgi:hypothetical protein
MNNYSCLWIIICHKNIDTYFLPFNILHMKKNLLLFLFTVLCQIVAYTQTTYSIDFSNSLQRSDGTTELLLTASDIYNSMDLAAIESADVINISINNETFNINNDQFKSTKGYWNDHGTAVELPQKSFTVRDSSGVFMKLFVSENNIKGIIHNTNDKYELTLDDNEEITIEETRCGVPPVNFVEIDITIGLSTDQTFRIYMEVAI